MNPLLSLLSKQKQSTAPQLNKDSNLLGMISDIKSGKIDPKQKSLSFLDQMTPQQKQAVKKLIPQLSKLGGMFGVSKQNMNSFMSEVNKHL